VRRGFLGSYAILLVAVLLSAAALAKSPIELELTSFKVVAVTNSEGKSVEKLVAAREVLPGDILEWHLRATNKSDERIEDVILVIPIPPETYYLEGSASPLVLKRGDKEEVFTPEFSYNGGKTYGTPPLYKKVVEVVNGKTVERLVEVPPEEYTHVRWVVSYLLPGETVEVHLRTVVR